MATITWNVKFFAILIFATPLYFHFSQTILSNNIYSIW
ncbi:hypothetical protein B4084_3555 [Bacillus cereus]|nr:hypothetical protein B4084_3555 [Bacillus cereus]